MNEEDVSIINFADPSIIEGKKSIPLRSVQSVEIKSDSKSLYIAGRGSNSIFGYNPSSCIYLIDAEKNKLIGECLSYLHKIFCRILPNFLFLIKT